MNSRSRLGNTKGMFVRGMQIEVIFDPGCPWCFIGKRQLERALALRPGIDVRLKWWPFLLNPDLPPEGVDRSSQLIRKFGSEARVGRVHVAIAEVGRAVGIEFAFDRIRRTPNTLNAHRIVRFAAMYGCADLMVEALFYTYFVRGRDIGDLRVLMQLGIDMHLDPRSLRVFLKSDTDLASILGDNARAHRLGINGVPAFVFDNAFVTCGAQEPPVLARMIDVAREAEQQPMLVDIGGAEDDGSARRTLIDSRRS